MSKEIEKLIGPIRFGVTDGEVGVGPFTGVQINPANNEIEKVVDDVVVETYVKSTTGNNVETVIGGVNVVIDNTDPNNPVISMYNESGDVETVVAGQNISVDNSDPSNPIVNVVGIEDGAEVNQTNSEIKTQYESNGDTNAFTDSEKIDVSNNTVHVALTTGNPHNVSSSDLNLELVDNTPDENKEVSIPQKEALDLKRNISNVISGVVTSGITPESGYDWGNISNLPDDISTDVDQLGRTVSTGLFRIIIDLGVDEYLTALRYKNYRQVTGQSNSDGGVKTCKIYLAESIWAPSTAYNDLTGLGDPFFNGDLERQENINTEETLPFTTTIKTQYIIIDVVDQQSTSVFTGLRSFWVLKSDVLGGDDGKTLVDYGGSITQEGKATLPMYEGSGSAKGSALPAMQRKVDIGCTNRWDFLEAPGGVVPATIGSIPLTISGTPTLVDSGLAIYKIGDIYYGRWTLQGDSAQKLSDVLYADLNGGVEAVGSESFFDLSKEFAITFWWTRRSSADGFLIGQDSVLDTDGFGFYYESSILKFKAHNGTSVDVVNHIAESSDRTYCISLTNRINKTTGAFEFAYAYKGSIGTADLDSVRGAVAVTPRPLTIGGKLTTGTGSAITESPKVYIGRVLYYDGVGFDDTRLNSSYGNPYAGFVITQTGSSSMDFTGPTFEYEAFIALVQQYYKGKVDCMFINFAKGGNTFYSGAPDDYDFPEFIAGEPRRELEADDSISRAMEARSDMHISWYPSNFTSSNFPLISGSRVSQEMMNVNRACQRVCNENGTMYIVVTPSSNNGTITDGTGRNRGDVHRGVSNDLFAEGGLVVSGFLNEESEGNGTLPEYDADGTHYTELFHSELANKFIGFIDPIMKLSKIILDFRTTNW